MDLKRPNLDEAMRDLKEMRQGIASACESIVEKAQRDLDDMNGGLKQLAGAADLVAAASNVWVRDLDFRDIDKHHQYISARLDINSHMGHPDGIAREDYRMRGDEGTIVKPGRYRAILCLIPIKDETP